MASSPRRLLALACGLGLNAVPRAALAQDNYEIQVYGSELVPPGATMLELHSNFTFSGEDRPLDGVQPTNHALHETIEVTHGFSEWLEIGFYLFTSWRNGDGWEWVGDHIRPRLSVPARLHWPVGLSLSQEIGYQQRRFSVDTWTWEIRPIVDRQLGRWYVSLNPTIERALSGATAGTGFSFSPNARVSVQATSVVTLGLEYYGGFGPLTDFAPLDQTEQQIYPTLDLDLGPDWEFNLGAGIGLTRETDRFLLKLIVGRRVGGAPRGSDR
jgi:hypothetical protein